MIEIIQDKNSEMLQINKDGKCLFEGNEWDFDRSGGSFKKLFEGAGLKVEVKDKPYNEW